MKPGGVYRYIYSHHPYPKLMGLKMRADTVSGEYLRSTRGDATAHLTSMSNHAMSNELETTGCKHVMVMSVAYLWLGCNGRSFITIHFMEISDVWACS